MNISETELKGVYIITPPIYSDNRGQFIKTFHIDTLKDARIDMIVRESFYSISHKNVIRGMHFQTPPQDHSKIVYCPAGAIRDVVLDIRRNSPTYGKTISIELTPENGKVIYIPSGFAHGFLSLKDNSITTYLQSTVRSPEHEGGIRSDSFGFDWGIPGPILSSRDQSFPALSDYISVFEYHPTT